MPEYESLARSALLEMTAASTVGDYLSQTAEDDGSTTVRFASAQPGYPDWLWTVSVADVEGGPATVLEAELLPGDGSLLSPDWVPWSERLADYKAAQEALDAAAVDAASDDDDESDDDDDGSDDDDDGSDDDDLDDLDDLDELDNDGLHGGDLDGVDIDDLDPDADDPDSVDDEG